MTNYIIIIIILVLSSFSGISPPCSKQKNNGTCSTCLLVVITFNYLRVGQVETDISHR